MDLLFKNMTEKHKNNVMDIFNYYIEKTYAAYPENKLSVEYYNQFLERTKNYPAFAIYDENIFVGFCYLSPYNKYSTFNECATITYFIDKNLVGKGIGKQALKKLELEAMKKGIKTILANISSKNEQSISFHLKNGFRECGKFEKIGKKNDKYFDIIWMQKEL